MRIELSSLLTPLAIVVFGQILYHCTAKKIDPSIRPWEVIALAYFAATIFVFIFGFISGNIQRSGLVSWRNISLALPIAAAVACIELGYIYSYRHGLPINIGALGVLAITTVVLVPIGSLFFDEPINLRVVLGALLTVIGISFMRT